MPAYFVPDLSPEARTELRARPARVIFLAESPHTQEIAPPKIEDRRPLCGAAGRQWWSMVSDVTEADPNSDTSLKRLLEICRNHGIVIMNAVQFPLDPKIAKKIRDAEPKRNLGFTKLAGPDSYKKLKETPAVQGALLSLRRRLLHPSVADLPIYCLGNDAHWFATEALSDCAGRIRGKIPHPSAWRRNREFPKRAREVLEKVLR